MFVIFAEWYNLKALLGDPILILVRSLWGLELTKISLGQVFSESFWFPLPLPLYYCSTLDTVQCKQLTASLRRALLTFKPLSSQNLNFWIMSWDTPVSTSTDCRITLFRFSRLYFLWYFNKFCLFHLLCPGEYWMVCLTLISLHSA